MPTRKSTVDRAILFRNPDRVPVWVDSDNIKHSDVLTYDLSLSDVDNPQKSEWGFARTKSKSGSWIVPTEPTLPEWKQVDLLQIPTMDAPRRLGGIVQMAQVCEDRYRIASFGLSGYSIYSALRGAELSTVDFLVETDRFVELMEYIFEFESDMFDLLMRKGFHAVEFCDDWGPRKTSRITLSMWRCLLKRHYAREFKLAKESGLHIWFRTSSESSEFFGDLKEIGVDVIRIEEPYKMELSEIGRLHRGKICFAVRLDELITDDKNAEEEMITHLFDCLGTPYGGFIATIADNVPEKKITRIAKIASQLVQNAKSQMPEN